MKLYRLWYSPFARKVQMLLDLLHAPYTIVEVPYSDRDELARLTGGHIHVPVLVDDTGKVLTGSRTISEHLLAGEGRWLAPTPWEGPVWAYADFFDNELENVLFRLASPAVRDRWSRPGDRALYVLLKERKFGSGCVDEWERIRPELIADAQELLGPTLRTLAARPFLFGDQPTLADAALYGQCVMVEEAHPPLLAQVAEPLVSFSRRLETVASITPGGRPRRDE